VYDREFKAFLSAFFDKHALHNPETEVVNAVDDRAFNKISQIKKALDDVNDPTTVQVRLASGRVHQAAALQG
jgi:hypothetical protein